jgi:hypothetical protein
VAFVFAFLKLLRTLARQCFPACSPFLKTDHALNCLALQPVPPHRIHAEEGPRRDIELGVVPVRPPLVVQFLLLGSSIRGLSQCLSRLAGT